MSASSQQSPRSTGRATTSPDIHHASPPDLARSDNASSPPPIVSQILYLVDRTIREASDKGLRDPMKSTRRIAKYAIEPAKNNLCDRTVKNVNNTMSAKWELNRLAQSAGGKKSVQRRILLGLFEIFQQAEGDFFALFIKHQDDLTKVSDELKALIGSDVEFDRLTRSIPHMARGSSWGNMTIGSPNPYIVMTDHGPDFTIPEEMEAIAQASQDQGPGEDVQHINYPDF
ncbi:hypothetical protein LTR56_019691 [Elasticomyces elasticus]|nr:hypothetical protein LTR56_019691 [Elasticomyces elasticus]KAK3633992.1 hypothetical protein LTR22_019859 [Elasticomyces elasticus]KAK4911113.1 hypothetical protein LTR49_020280 [Elasticomyces elasticus]KAK5750659.1 hypothetical protein LTS12_019280 [Elasticomyces elasticus]